eukprot:748727-Hanusia_phi.AAC.1
MGSPLHNSSAVIRSNGHAGTLHTSPFASLSLKQVCPFFGCPHRPHLYRLRELWFQNEQAHGNYGGSKTSEPAEFSSCSESSSSTAYHNLKLAHRGKPFSSSGDFTRFTVVPS